MRPLPPSDPNMIGPSRLAQHNSRLKRREGLILPTPRTYRWAVDGSLGTTSAGSTLTLTTLSGIYIQPGEVLGFFVRMDVQSSVASTAARVVVDSPDLGSTSANLIYKTFPATRDTYVSSPGEENGPVDGSIDYPGGFVWLHSYWDGASEAGQVTGPTAISSNIKIARQTGSGNLTVYNLRATAMIL
jgi:hypothetical protein